jgi:hypothetical protein
MMRVTGFVHSYRTIGFVLGGFDLFKVAACHAQLCLVIYMCVSSLSVYKGG